jgi:MFS transporter, LPLT family, lysophospholipid transporter
MIFVHNQRLAMALMVGIGACAGFFVVPMNALLQHRGHVLMGAGHSIAVQNFNENIGIFVMVGLYWAMGRAGLSVDTAIVLFGLFVSGTMALVMLLHRRYHLRGELLHLVAGDVHPKAQAAKSGHGGPA